MSKELEREYHYKDGSRYYWRIKVWKSDERPSWADSDSIDFIWSYTIERSFSGEESWNRVFENEIQGQYDIFPDMSDILLDFQSYINSFVVGASDSETGAKNITKVECMDCGILEYESDMTSIVVNRERYYICQHCCNANGVPV